jgi:spore germination protein KC
MKKVIRLRRLSLLLVCSLLTGCWDAHSIEQRLFAVSMSIDKVQAGYEVGVQIPIPTLIAGQGSGGGSGGSGQGAVQTFSGKGTTWIDALSDVQSQANFPLFLGHTVILFLGEELAQVGISPILDGLRRNPEVRRQTRPVIVKGKGDEAAKTSVRLEQIPTLYMKDMLDNHFLAGRIPEGALGNLFTNLSNPSLEAPLLHYVEARKEGYSWLGMAVFHRDKMVGVIDKDETSVLQHLREQKGGWMIDVPCGKESGVFVFQPRTVKRKIHLTKQSVIQVQVKVKGKIMDKSCKLNLDDPKMLRVASQLVADKYERQARKLIQRAQTELKTDIFHFGHYLHAYYPQRWKGEKWEKEFAQIPIEVSYQVVIQ